MSAFKIVTVYATGMIAYNIFSNSPFILYTAVKTGFYLVRGVAVNLSIILRSVGEKLSESWQGNNIDNLDELEDLEDPTKWKLIDQYKDHEGRSTSIYMEIDHNVNNRHNDEKRSYYL